MFRADRRRLFDLVKEGGFNALRFGGSTRWRGESLAGGETTYVSTSLEPKQVALYAATELVEFGSDRKFIPVYVIDLGRLTAAWARSGINLNQHFRVLGRVASDEFEILFERIPISAIKGFRMAGMVPVRVNGVKMGFDGMLKTGFIGPFYRNPAYIPPP